MEPPTYKLTPIKDAVYRFLDGKSSPKVSTSTTIPFPNHPI